MKSISLAIAAFMHTLTSTRTWYDRAVFSGDTTALSASAKRGRLLFFSDSLQCHTCHSGFNFSGGLSDTRIPVEDRLYFNTGLYNVDGKGAYPAYDPGLFEKTGHPKHQGRFRVPSLRNLGFTAPYMHDGSVATLSEVIDIYAEGGRNIGYGIYKGDGRKNPYKDRLIKGFTVNAGQKADLINFLLSLNDSSFIRNPAYQNPFTGDETKGENY